MKECICSSVMGKFKWKCPDQASQILENNFVRFSHKEVHVTAWHTLFCFHDYQVQINMFQFFTLLKLRALSHVSWFFLEHFEEASVNNHSKAVKELDVCKNTWPKEQAELPTNVTCINKRVYLMDCEEPDQKRQKNNYMLDSLWF